MARWFQAASPAKVNLGLEVLSRRADGFHEIESLMAAVGVYDTVWMRALPEPQLLVRCQWADGWAARERRRATSHSSFPALRSESLPQGEANLAWRAVDALRRRVGGESGTTGLELRIEKRIPAAAGLGGASGNAATALTLANRVWGLGWPRERLAEIAAEVGSDVPFFLTGGAAVVQGRGERIEPVSAGGALSLVLAKPAEGLSTADVYRSCRPWASQGGALRAPPWSAGPAVAAWRGGSLAELARTMFNRLEAPARELCSAVSRTLGLLRQAGCAAMMSGSGTCCLGLCRSQAEARRVARWLAGTGLAWVVPTVTLPARELAGGLATGGACPDPGG